MTLKPANYKYDVPKVPHLPEEKEWDMSMRKLS